MKAHRKLSSDVSWLLGARYQIANLFVGRNLRRHYSASLLNGIKAIGPTQARGPKVPNLHQSRARQTSLYPCDYLLTFNWIFIWSQPLFLKSFKPSRTHLPLHFSPCIWRAELLLNQMPSFSLLRQRLPQFKTLVLTFNLDFRSHHYTSGLETTSATTDWATQAFYRRQNG